MPYKPTGDEHFTSYGRNPHAHGYVTKVYNFLRRSKFVEPDTVELVNFEKNNALFSTPVIDVSGNLLLIPHRDGQQLYKVTVNREHNNYVTVILDPVENELVKCCCLSLSFENDLTAYSIHYRESKWELSNGDKTETIYALGYRQKSTGKRFVALQLAAYTGLDIEYECFVGIDLRNGSKYSVTSVEHNLGLYGQANTVRDAPFLAKSIMAHIRITDFPADGTSALEGGAGDAVIVKLASDKAENDDAPAAPVKMIPALASNETGVIGKSTQAVVEAEAERVAPYLNDTQPSEWVDGVKKEFLRILFNKQIKNKGVPLSMDEARAADRPSQARTFGLVENDAISEAFEKIKIFLKTESADPAAAPRIISNPDDFLRVFSRMFGEPLSNYLKNHPKLRKHYGFVAPGKLRELFEDVITRSKSSTKVKEELRNKLAECDFSKMDATVNKWMRQFEKEIGLHFFAPAYHDMWRLWHSKLYAKPSSKKLMGHSVYMGSSRRSGEYYTSIFNTILNMFYVTCCYVKMGLSVSEAMDMVGLVGGDDGLHPSLDSEVAVEVATTLGFRVKVAIKSFNEPVSFLGLVRYDHDVYSYDPLRFVTKCSSVATGAGIPPQEATYRKFEAFAQLYPSVPIVGTISRAVLRVLIAKGYKGKEAKYDLAARNINGFMTTMLLENNGLMPCKATRDELLGYVARSLDIEIATLVRIEDAYENASDFSQFPSHVLKLKGKEFKFPTMFQGNIYAGDRRPAGELEKFSSDNSFRPGTSLTSRATHNAPKDQERKATQSDCDSPQSSPADGSDSGENQQSPNSHQTQRRKRRRKAKVDPGRTIVH